jgi:putative transposase
MRAIKAKIRGLKKPQFKRLKELTHHAKNLYNQTLWTLREAYKATGQYFSYPQMDKAMKQVTNLEGEVNYRFLKAKVAQQTLRRVDKNFKSFFTATKDFKKNPKKYSSQPNPPHFKQKPQDNLVYDYQAFSIKGEIIILEKGLEIKLPKQLVGKTIKQVEILPKFNTFHAVFIYEEDPNDFVQVPKNEKVMSIDLGLNNLATCVTNGIIKPFIIDGRKLKSINAYYNKRKAKLQAKLEKQRGRKWSNKLQSLTDWRNAYINDYMHRATHLVVKSCVENEISKVFIGDVSKSLDHINLGKRTNQNFVNLSLGQFVEKLSYKLGSHGIELVVTNESYTSKASFISGDKMPKQYEPKTNPTFNGRRIKRGLYQSSDGTLLNADVNGAYNILRKNDSNFSFSQLFSTVGNKIGAWLHPTGRIRFLNHKPSNPKRKRGDNGLILPYSHQSKLFT